MSRHWKPRTHRRQTPPSKPLRRRKRRSYGWGQLRLAILGSVFVVIAYASVPAAGGGTALSPAGVSVIDGDTFRYRGDKIRIADIDTPEIKARCDHEAELAARATERLEELLLAGPFELRPIPGRDEDRYGRKLRVVTRGGRSIGDQLVSEGLARTWTGRREPWCEEEEV